MKSAIAIFAAAALLLPTVPAHALTEADQALSAMAARENKFAVAYAAMLALPPIYVSYCRSQLAIDTGSLPRNGLLPYGVDLDRIPAAALPSAIHAREEYESVFLQLCLADARQKLNATPRAPVAVPPVP